jgi:hypothetical protein
VRGIEVTTADPDPVEARLKDIRWITDAGLSRLDPRELLDELLDRARDILRADTAAALLLDFSSGQLIATAAAGLEEEVRQGVRIPVGRGFAGRMACRPPARKGQPAISRARARSAVTGTTCRGSQPSWPRPRRA